MAFTDKNSGLLYVIQPVEKNVGKCVFPQQLGYRRWTATPSAFFFFLMEAFKSAAAIVWVEVGVL